MQRRSLSHTLWLADRLVGTLSVEQFGVALRSGAWQPRLNVYRYPHHFEVVVELAGVSANDVEIVGLDANHVRISGVRRWPELRCQETGVACQHTAILEIEDGHFERILEFPSIIDQNQLEVAQDQGMLWIRVPMLEAPNA